MVKTSPCLKYVGYPCAVARFSLCIYSVIGWEKCVVRPWLEPGSFAYRAIAILPKLSGCPTQYLPYGEYPDNNNNITIFVYTGDTDKPGETYRSTLAYTFCWGWWGKTFRVTEITSNVEWNECKILLYTVNSKYSEFPLIRPRIVFVESGLNSEQVSLMTPIYIKNAFLVLKQVVLIARVVFLVSGLYSGILLYREQYG